jgi:hypothetical protein
MKEIAGIKTTPVSEKYKAKHSKMTGNKPLRDMPSDQFARSVCSIIESPRTREQITS